MTDASAALGEGSRRERGEDDRDAAREHDVERDDEEVPVAPAGGRRVKAAMSTATSVNGKLATRVVISSFSSVTYSARAGLTLLRLRRMLCEHTVPIARIAPSDVLIDAATMPMRHQPPMKVGASCVSSLRFAIGSGSHIAHVGRSRMREHVSASNSAGAAQPSGP